MTCLRVVIYQPPLSCFSGDLMTHRVSMISIGLLPPMVDGVSRMAECHGEPVEPVEAVEAVEA